MEDVVDRRGPDDLGPGGHRPPVPQLRLHPGHFREDFRQALHKPPLVRLLKGAAHRAAGELVGRHGGVVPPEGALKRLIDLPFLAQEIRGLDERGNVYPHGPLAVVVQGLD